MSLPVTSWSESEERYLTEDVRNQLGATTNPQERTVFTLTRESLEHAIDNEVRPADVAPYVVGINTEGYGVYTYRNSLTKTGLISFDSSVNQLETQSFWTNLLTDVIKDTGSPALAVQTINTAASRMIYSHWIGSFTAEAPAHITYLTDFRVPMAASGYAAVMAVIAAQVALLIIVGVMFSSCTSSVLNDAWLVVSQVSSSSGAVGTLVREKAVTDADVVRFVGEGASGGVRKRLVVRDGAFREPDNV